MKKSKPYLHTYCVYRIGKLGLSQTAIATKCNATPVTINLVIRGARTSARLQKQIAVILGYPDWKSLETAARLFFDVEAYLENQRRAAL
jgi:transcriptional regulator with XRE-family HTH domain